MQRTSLHTAFVVVIGVIAACVQPIQTARAQTSAAADAVPAGDRPAIVRFSFNGVAWREVITWIAEEAGLALHVDSVPAGSFTYTDPQPFSHQDAIDRINLFLLPQGHTLVRSGNLLSVINLSDPRSLQQLDSLAELVRPDDLKTRPKHDVVKCLFPLGELAAEDAVEELSAIKLMMQPSVFSKTNQLLVTGTVSKLQSVKMVLDSFEPSTLDNGTIVASFQLDHVNAEDVLTVARPHLGLATGEMIGIDVSLSSDILGKNIFVTGVEDKVKLIERLVQSVDVPDDSLTADTSDATLQAHEVVGGNVDLAYDVLQTLLAGQDIRLSKNETAGTIVALAPPKTQKDIADAVSQLAADAATFEVITLSKVDPYVAIGLIEEMLDLSTLYDDDDDDSEAPPKIDADPENRRLFVRGKPAQIEEIKRIVEGLDQKSQSGTDGDARIRLLSLTGNHARQTLAAAARFWRLPNPILLIESDQASKPAERVVYDAPSGGPTNELLDIMESKTPENYVSAGSRTKILDSPKTDITKTAIECQLTSRGLLIQCDDLSVLNQFETHLETLAGPSDATTNEPIVYYLKFTRPVDAIRMLAELLDGSAAVSSDSLINATVSSPGSSLGSLITNRDGTITLIAGTATIVADSRLNRLIAQGTAEDIANVEKYLRIIEKESSITEIETFGRSHIIELVNTRASEVETAIRQAFAGRVVEAVSPATAAGDGGNRPQPARSNDDNGQDRDRKADSKKQPKSASKQAIDLEPKMTLAVHEPSNSLIVTAPDHLFSEVQELAKTIDQRGEQTVEVFSSSNDEVMSAILQELFEGGSSSRSPSRGSSSRVSSSRSRDR
ncbi:secretin N-terminal domain-containing protein [Roseiconus lacunae]|uniref:Secretin N-terminal domain-containing protein n=1 Tax=Roseiconus lacunae TaxID=2605694 RepID=A0ABT7PRW9_9BACT|nr:secretin N-terminal domain-containing protein [Roseiconus lacunae]MDM4019088.1 secretin N-terminal domain-containing protein [Roseiconus lacunae]